ncbi:MAG TPA: HAD-IIA family hydrolase [Marmoricola sp.]|nr:HAD-IIA family hydrolase [Marmoricola sp.]
MLKPADRPLPALYDLAVLDLDGVVYVGREAVERAVGSISEARARGMKIAFVTNNAARTPDAVAAHLRALGLEASADDVVSSAQAAAHLLARDLEAGAEVYLMGGDGLEQALLERGLRPVTSPGEGVAAVAQGYGPEMPWRRVVDGAILVASGLPWVASNTDMTIPTERGLGPGNGTLVDLVAGFADREPRVAGKPQAALFDETIERVGGERPLFVGDRLDTDIAGAVAVGWDSLLVMTGVTGLAELVAAPSAQRPSYLAADLSGLLEQHPAVAPSGPGVELGGWRAVVGDGTLAVTGDGSPSDWWRAVAVASWGHLDATGEPVDVGNLTPPR